MALKKNQSETIIIGGGLSGLVTAALLEKAGHDYVLFEASDEFGGLARGQNHQGVWLDYGLKSLPVGNITLNPLLKLKEDLNLKVNIETLLDGALTYTKSGFVEFVGFGDTKNKKLITELSYYMEGPRLTVSNGWKALIDELLQIIPENKRRLKSHITKLSLEDGKIKSVTINGAETHSAEAFVYTLSPSLLLNLLPPGALSPKTVQKLSKTEPLTALSLDLATSKKVSDYKNILLLSDEGLYVVGQFVSNADPLRQSEGLNLSSWLCLLDAEEAQDDEFVSKTLKSMKRLIKKAFPALMDESHWERIILSPKSHGGAVEITQQIVNFYPVGGLFLNNDYKYLSAALFGAKRVSEEIISHSLSLKEKNMFEDVGI